MGYRLREIKAESKFSQELSLEVIGRVVPKAAITAVLADAGICLFLSIENEPT